MLTVHSVQVRRTVRSDFEDGPLGKTVEVRISVGSLLAIERRSNLMNRKAERQINEIHHLLMSPFGR